MTNRQGIYAPVKIRRLADELVESQDADGCMEQLCKMYPNLGSRKNALTCIKSLIIEREVRHPEFDARVEEYDRQLMQCYKDKGDHSDLQRVMALRDFRACPLKRQVQVQKKLLLNDFTELCDKRDKEFFASLPLVPEWYDRLQLSREDVQTILSQNSRRLMELSSNVVKLEKIDDLVQTCRNILRSARSTPEEIAVALGVCTGRRMVEIILMGTFQENPYKRYSVRFRGQVKTGLRNVRTMRDAESEQVVIIPTLSSGRYVCAAAAWLQKVNKGTTPRDVNQMWCTKLNHAVKTIVHPELTFHDLRRLYVLVTYEAFKPHTYSLNAWAAKLLNHKDLVMSIHYTRLQISGLGKTCKRLQERTRDD